LIAHGLQRTARLGRREISLPQPRQFRFFRPFITIVFIGSHFPNGFQLSDGSQYTFGFHVVVDSHPAIGFQTLHDSQYDTGFHHTIGSQLRFGFHNRIGIGHHINNVVSIDLWIHNYIMDFI
jgi:hypothetical protein